jgi:hypothetical protein
MICLDDLLFGNPTWEQIVEFFKDGEFCGEEYLILGIKKHLRTEEDRKMLFDLDLEISDCLNGRYAEEEKQVKLMYKRWNDKLGFQSFN